MRQATLLACGILLGSAATGDLGFAQSINVDFGPASSLPSNPYHGAGSAGVWNAIGVLPPAQRAPLVAIDGSPVPAKIYMIGGTQLLASNDPVTSGDDEALLDDMLIGFNNPLDVCIFFESLDGGDYDVVVYAMTPNDPDLESRVRVDYATPEIVFVGGAWPGFHKEGTTYSRHTVTVTDGTLWLHSGLLGSLVQSGINGVQIRPLPPTGVGALEPFEPRGTVQLSILPNPARGLQVLELFCARSTRGWLEIEDVRGRSVWSRTVELAPGENRLAWDGRDLHGRRVAAGVYFLRFRGTGSISQQTKLVRID
jgi:hypothetical protein